MMETALRALIIEDSEDDALLLAHRLAEGGYQMHWRRVDTPRALEAALDAEQEDVAGFAMAQGQPAWARAILLEQALPTAGREGIWSGETALLGRDGREIPVSQVVIAHQAPDGGVEFFSTIARDITERKRAEEELRLLQSITQAVSEAGDTVAALAVTLEKVCEATPWLLAQAWTPRPDGTAIECSAAWWGRGPDLDGFRAASLGFAFAPGEDLPGRVWASRQAVWVADVTRERDGPRAPLAREAGLKAALAVPVAADGEVLAVLEFFLDAPREEDERLTRLVCAVARQLGDVLQRKRAEARLHYLAHHDALTGLPNRVLFADRLAQALRDAHRRERLVGVAFLDLDRFKTINDSLGHDIGDRFLKAVAERLTRRMREGDTVARLAGDEFAFVLADMGHVNDAAHVAQKILDSLAEPFDVGGHELYTSASLGMTLHPIDEGDAEALLRNADIAMYRAKERGGNLYEFYAADMSARAHARLALENALRRAYERGEFLLHYQPIVDLASGRVAAVEALLRWRHPERGLVPPDEFIPVAEETGLIGPLGEWALRTACQECQRCHRGIDGLPVRLAVNVSARQMDRGRFAGMVTRVLDETGFDPRRLDLEITESLLMHNAGDAREVMNELGELGIRFSIDDFGTGYSSLAYLKHLPIGHVKIDRSFVRDIPTDANDVAIVTAILAMAGSLGIRVIAEGVETEAQLEFLRERDCDAVQGYYFSRPLAAGELAPLLAGNGLPPP